jgi:hypothetical protein
MRKRVFTEITAAFALAVGLLSPVHAQEIDFSGGWSPLFHEDGPERIPGPELADYTGIPVNDTARMRGDSYDSNRISVVSEYQCRMHGGDYSMRGLAEMQITKTLDTQHQLVAFHTRMGFHNQERTIYLDGRPHPSKYDAHTWSGFSTGVWQGNMLSIYTTHLKPNYLRRNGLPASAQRTFTEHWVMHGNYLSVVTAINDPVFLTEPLVRTQTWIRDPAIQITSNHCEYGPEVLGESADDVPHYLPGQNPYLAEWAEWYGVPVEATRGGAETMYPEYRELLPQTWSTLDRCDRYCECFNGSGSERPGDMFGCDLRVGAAETGIEAAAAESRERNERAE